MEITFHFFASLRDVIGTHDLVLDIPEDATLRMALDHLIACYPHLAGEQDAWHFAVNKVRADTGAVLQPGDSVSVFPYIAGG
jgi:molybdopterin converting factor small subunit